MPTRANIIVKDEHSQLWFYRHSGGFPKETLPLLEKFLEWVKSGKIRDNLLQSAGWLIVLGAMEYNTMPKFDTEPPRFEGDKVFGIIDSIEEPKDWRVGSIEPTTGEHGDIEYLYTVDLVAKTVTYV